MRRTDRLRLATFNIKHGAPARDNRGDPEAVAAACANLEADVLALQETDIGLSRSGRADLAAAAARAAGMNVVFGPAIELRGGQYGNALLVRGDIEGQDVVKLDDSTRLEGRQGGRAPTRNEPRSAIVATVRVGGHRLSVAATHLATQSAVGKKQLSQAAANLQSMAEPWVLMGDLNLTPDEVLSEPLLGSMQLVSGPATFPAWRPTRRIDHIAFRGLALLGADSVQAVRSPEVSDHLALVADVTVVH